MPTYAYRCPSCQHAFERFHKMSDTHPQPCPECGTEAARVITGGAGLVFKGSGFYITDYKKSTGDGPDKAGKGDHKPADKKPAAKKGSSTPKPGPDAPSSKSSGGEAS